MKNKELIHNNQEHRIARRQNGGILSFEIDLIPFHHENNPNYPGHHQKNTAWMDARYTFSEFVPCMTLAHSDSGFVASKSLSHSTLYGHGNISSCRLSIIW